MSFTYKKHEKFPDFVLVRKFSGEVDVNEIIKSWEFLLENKMITVQTEGVINNITNCTLNMNMDSFHELTAFLKKNDQLRKLKLAVICDNPEAIVFPTLAEFEEIELSIKPFSTEEAALKWIMFE